MVNFDKSAITFSPNTSPQAIDDIKRIFSVGVTLSHDLYLGLPTFSFKSKRLQFAYIRERIYSKMQSCGSKFFSMGGREVLIKSVLQAIRRYAMSCFKLPITLCRSIEQE